MAFQMLKDCFPIPQHSGEWSLVKQNRNNCHPIKIYSQLEKTYNPYRKLRKGKINISGSWNRKDKLTKKLSIARKRLGKKENNEEKSAEENTSARRRIFPVVVDQELKIENHR